MGTFLTLCSKRSAREHVEITEEPIDAWLLFNRKPIISCDRTTPKRVINFPTFLITYMGNRFQILASCMEETPKKIVGNNCFLCSFPLIPQARIRVFGKSSVDIAYLIACAVEIDLSVFSSSNPFVCNRCYKRLLRFEKAKPNLQSLQEEIKEDFKKGANRTKRLRRNSAMMVNKMDRPNTTPTEPLNRAKA